MVVLTVCGVFACLEIMFARNWLIECHFNGMDAQCAKMTEFIFGFYGICE